MGLPTVLLDGMSEGSDSAERSPASISIDGFSRPGNAPRTTCCATIPSVTERRRLPWLLSLPLMAAGSFAAHSLGVVAFAARRAATGDADGGIELHGRVDHGSLMVIGVMRDGG